MATNVNVLDRAPDTLMKALGWALAPLEDPIGLDRPLWRDTSRWNGFYNAKVAYENGVCGIAARAAVSWGYQDGFFKSTYESAGNAGMYRTSYFVPYPDQPLIKQADNWYSMHPEIDIVPRVIDLELSRGVIPIKIADFMWQLSDLVKARDGLRPIIYTRYQLVDKWLASWSAERLNLHWWWLAQYLWDRTREHPGPPTYPKNILESRIILHQTADKKAGFPGEAQSAALDYDRWELGNIANMQQWIETYWASGDEPPYEPPDEEPDTDIEPIQPIKVAKVNVQALNMRAQPDVNSKDLGEIMGNSIVPITDIEGDWNRVEGWVHGKYLKEL